MSTTIEIAVDPDKTYEIVDGRPEEKEMGGAKHGGVGARLGRRLGTHVEKTRLGEVYGPDTSFKIGRNERIPDVSFVAAARIPPDGEPDNVWPIPPDLAIEVISPNDVYEKVLAKVREYFEAGVRQVWLVSVEQRTVMIYVSPTEVVILEEHDELDGGEIVPGFRCRVSEIFTLPPHASSRS